MALYAPYSAGAQSPTPPAQPSPLAQPSPPAQEPDDESGGSAIIYVVRRGWHIDVGFAASDLRPPLRSLDASFPGVKYLIFGFGDRHYLLAKDRGITVPLATMWPGPGLILATGLVALPQDAFGGGHVITLTVTARQAEDAQAFIWQTLESPTPYATGPYGGSLYYGARARYSAFHTCNTWAAESLAAAGLPIRRSGVIFAGQLWRQVRRLGKIDPTARARQVPAAGRPPPVSALPHPPGAEESDVHEYANQPSDADGNAQDFLGAHASPLGILRLDQQGGLLPFWHTTVVPEF